MSNEEVRQALTSTISDARYSRRRYQDGSVSVWTNGPLDIANAIMREFDVTPKGPTA